MIAVYLRVSTADQSTANQEPETLAVARAVSVRLGCAVEVFRDTASGAAIVRPEWDRLRAAIRSRKVRGVVVWALDRAGRRMLDVLSFVRDCRERGVECHSVREHWLSTTGPVADVLVAVLAWVAESERDRLKERTRAGLERVKRTGSKSGLPVGRPSKRADAARACDWMDAENLRLSQPNAPQEGWVSCREAAERFGLGVSSVQRELQRRRAATLQSSQKGSGGAPLPESPPDASPTDSAD